MWLIASMKTLISNEITLWGSIYSWVLGILLDCLRRWGMVFAMQAPLGLTFTAVCRPLLFYSIKQQGQSLICKTEQCREGWDVFEFLFWCSECGHSLGKLLEYVHSSQETEQRWEDGELLILVLLLWPLWVVCCLLILSAWGLCLLSGSHREGTCGGLFFSISSASRRRSKLCSQLLRLQMKESGVPLHERKTFH